MTIVQALKDLVTAKGGSSSGKTILSVLRDLVTAMGGTNTGGKTISSAIEDVTDAVESGGGVSSDFSIAEVTIIGEYSNLLTVIVEESGSESVMTATQPYTGTVKVPLYKGNYILALEIPIFSSVSVTGNAEIIMDGMGIYITGDCTITVP